MCEQREWYMLSIITVKENKKPVLFNTQAKNEEELREYIKIQLDKFFGSNVKSSSINLNKSFYANNDGKDILVAAYNKWTLTGC